MSLSGPIVEPKGVRQRRRRRVSVPTCPPCTVALVVGKTREPLSSDESQFRVFAESRGPSAGPAAPMTFTGLGRHDGAPLRLHAGVLFARRVQGPVDATQELSGRVAVMVFGVCRVTHPSVARGGRGGGSGWKTAREASRACRPSGGGRETFRFLLRNNPDLFALL